MGLFSKLTGRDNPATSATAASDFSLNTSPSSASSSSTPATDAPSGLSSSGLPQDDIFTAEDAYDMGMDVWDTYLASGMADRVAYDESVSLLDSAARRGHAQAYIQLADCYMKGEQPRTEESMECLRKAFELGEDIAAIKLCAYYTSGYGCPRDLSKADEALRMLDERGTIQSLVYLAEAYDDEEDIPDLYNPERAFDVRVRIAGMTPETEKEIEQVADARYCAGMALYRGDFGRKDDNEALRWISSACDMGDYAACWWMAERFESGDLVPQNLRRAHDLYSEGFNNAPSHALDACADVARTLAGMLYEHPELIVDDEDPEYWLDVANRCDAEFARCFPQYA